MCIYIYIYIYIYNHICDIQTGEAPESQTLEDLAGELLAEKLAEVV